MRINIQAIRYPHGRWENGSIRNLLVFLVLLSSSAFAFEGPGILKIYDQFVVSSAAARKCAQPDKETLTAFLANFQMVSIYAIQRLQNQFPNRTKEQIATAMKQKSQAITKKVDSIVAEKGCSDPGVQLVVKRFFVQAKWKPGM